MTTSADAGRGSLRDRVYDTLKRRIIEVEYQPGQRLIERDLAAELSVSRIPLREALRLLSAEGLVVIVPGRGTIVSPFTPSDVADLFDVRGAIEPLAARLAAERVDDDGIAALRDSLAAARAAVDDHHRLTDLNADFHAVLVAVCRNPLLATIARPLDARLRWLFHLTVEIDPVRQCVEHEAIFDTIVAGDAEGAARMALAHVESGRQAAVRLAATWASDDIDPVKVTHTRRRGERTGEAP